MTRTQFTFYESFYQAISNLKKKSDRADLYDAICSYALYGIEPDLSDAVHGMFALVRPNLDASRRKAQGAKARGSGKDTSKIPASSAEDAANKKKNKKEKENEYEYELENECYKAAPTRFRPPTVEEVRAFCQEKGYPVDPGRFVDYYAARGWSYGKGVPMKDWQAAVRTWVKNEPDTPSPPPQRKYRTVLLDGEWVDVPEEEAIAGA